MQCLVLAYSVEELKILKSTVWYSKELVNSNRKPTFLSKGLKNNYFLIYFNV